MNNKKENELLDKIQQEWLDEIDKEANLENTIIESSKDIAINLMNTQNKRCKCIIDDQEFILSYLPYMDEKLNKRMICVLSINVAHYKISLGNYRPAKIEAEYDDDLTELENVTNLIESYIRYVVGAIKPEEIIDKK